MDDFRVVDAHYVDVVEDYKGSPTLQLSGFIHFFKFCVRESMKNASYISKVFEKCHSLSKFSHKSIKIADTFEQLNKSISKAYVIRWNKEYMLIKPILSIGKK